MTDEKDIPETSYSLCFHKHIYVYFQAFGQLSQHLRLLFYQLLVVSWLIATCCSLVSSACNEIVSALLSGVVDVSVIVFFAFLVHFSFGFIEVSCLCLVLRKNILFDMSI